MISYREMTREQLLEEKENLQKAYDEVKAKGLKLNMARGKPGADQLDLSMDMLNILKKDDNLNDESDTDTRNYGLLDGIPEAKKLFADMLHVEPEEVIVGGNSSLNMMYDTVCRAMLFGFVDSPKPWKDYEKVKFLCPAPGYDRHFAICELMGIEMITVPMTEAGPDMDLVEKYVEEDEDIRGIWCVPFYSNPQGITYSDETVRRFAALKPKAKDFKIFWDNAYCIHHLTDTPDHLLDLFAECKKNGTEDRVLMFCSTSKISFPGAGVAAFAASRNNLSVIKKQLAAQTIGFDKIKQLRHVKFFGDYNGMLEHMQLHRQILEPKFEMVLRILEQEIAPLDIATWTKPNGGYFIALDTMNGCAKRVVELCKEAGVEMTPAGATYPYGVDPDDKNIRIAPTYPPVSELKVAAELFCICVKLASAEKLLEK